MGGGEDRQVGEPASGSAGGAEAGKCRGVCSLTSGSVGTSAGGRGAISPVTGSVMYSRLRASTLVPAQQAARPTVKTPSNVISAGLVRDLTNSAGT